MAVRKKTLMRAYRALLAELQQTIILYSDKEYIRGAPDIEAAVEELQKAKEMAAEIQGELDSMSETY